MSVCAYLDAYLWLRTIATLFSQLEFKMLITFRPLNGSMNERAQKTQKTELFKKTSK